MFRQSLLGIHTFLSKNRAQLTSKIRNSLGIICRMGDLFKLYFWDPLPTHPIAKGHVTVAIHDFGVIFWMDLGLVQASFIL